MPIGLLGIANGAIRVGAKLFQGVKRRREERLDKRATKLLDSRSKLDAALSVFNGGFINNAAGTQAMSSAADGLMEAKGNNLQPISGAQAVADQAQGGGKMNPMIFIIGGLALVFFFFIKKR